MIMPKKPTTQKQLLLEMEDLRSRLDEAEETLRAIRSGEVDALVVSGVDGEQVFTLKGADHSYRMLIEDMSEGALTLTAEGVILYANRSFAEMLKTPLEKVIGSAIHTWIAPDSQQIFQSLLRKGADEKRREQFVLIAGDGTLVPVYLSVSNLDINEMPDSFCLVATDLTEQKRSDAIAASEKLARKLLAASNQSRLELLSEIEARKRAEEILRLHSEIIGNMIEGAYLVRAKDAIIVYTNPKFEKMFGYGPDEMVGKHVSIVNATTDKIPDETAKEIIAILNKTGEWHGEVENIKKDGAHFWCYANVSMFDHVEHGRVILSVHTDITDRKQAEETLARRMTELSALNAMATIVNESMNVDEILNRAADEALRLIGIGSAAMYLLDEKAGELALVAHQGLSDEFVRAFSRLKLGEGLAGQVAQTGKPVILERLEDYPRAQRAYVEKEGIQSAASVPLIGSTGVIGVMNLASVSPQYFDVAGMELLVSLAQQIATGVEKARFYEREREALAAAAAAKSAIDTIEAMRDGLILYTMDGKITFVNPAFERMTGYEKSELAGTDVADLAQRIVKPGDPEKTIAHIGAVLEEKAPMSKSLTLVSKDGREVPVTSTLSFIRDVKGQHATAIVAFKDITQIKRAEEQLKEYAKQLEDTIAELRDTREQLVRSEKLAVLGQLAGGVAHELRNPLAVMSNAIYYLRSIITDADETTREYLEMISSEVGNAEGIVSDLLDFSRTRSLEREEVTASELVARVLEKRPSPEKVKVTTGIPPELPPVFVDPRQTGQVLGNLIANAYHAMAEGGNLTISAQAEKEKVSLFITDTGCGISKENMQKIFEPLFTTRARGIGLGLAVVKNLVEVNGGSIEVESEEGKGSTFTVALPIKEALSIVDC